MTSVKHRIPNHGIQLTITNSFHVLFVDYIENAVRTIANKSAIYIDGNTSANRPLLWQDSRCKNVSTIRLSNFSTFSVVWPFLLNNSLAH
jgi:hypothetical protein